MTTDAILALFKQRRKRPEMDAVTADRLEIARYYVRRAGDEVRDFNRWRDSYRIRTGRAA